MVYFDIYMYFTFLRIRVFDLKKKVVTKTRKCKHKSFKKLSLKMKNNITVLNTFIYF